jgi:hypothetical protein
MHEFDRKWQIFAARARQAPDAECSLPAGFAARVVARWQSPPNTSLSNLWLQLGLRALTAATAALVISALLEFHTIQRPSVFMPHIEDTVAQVIWML